MRIEPEEDNLMLNVKENRVNLLFTACIVWLPILNIYSSGVSGLGLGDIILVLFSLGFILVEKKLEIDRTGYWRFMLYIIGLSILLTLLISGYQISETITKLAKMSLYALIICQMSKRHFCVEQGLRLYINTSFIAAVYLLAQAMLHMATGIYLPLNLPFLTLANMEVGGTYYQSMVSGYEIFGFRYSGFFMEPAQFCQYTVYAVAILLFADEIGLTIRRKALKLAVICIGTIMSFSAMGYVLVLVVWVVWMLKRSESVESFVRKTAIIVIAAIVLIYVSIKTGAFDSMQARVAGISGSGITSGNMRILRGFEIYAEEPLIFKIFGIGAGNFSAFMQKFRISTRYDRFIPMTNEYMSGISTVLVYGGVVGLMLFLVPIIRFLKVKAFITRSMMLILLLILFSSSSLISAGFTTPMVLIYCLTMLIRETEANFEKSRYENRYVSPEI